MNGGRYGRGAAAHMGKEKAMNRGDPGIATLLGLSAI